MQTAELELPALRPSRSEGRIRQGQDPQRAAEVQRGAVAGDQDRRRPCGVLHTLQKVELRFGPTLVDRQKDGRLVAKVTIEGLKRKSGPRRDPIGVGGEVARILELQPSRLKEGGPGRFRTVSAGFRRGHAPPSLMRLTTSNPK